MTLSCYQKPLSDCTVAIAGLGLMGGSLALALRGRVGKVVGIARRQESIDQALRMEAIDEGYTTLADGAGQADIIVLATPIKVILRQIEEIGRLAQAGGLRQGAVVLDLGSTKQHICQAMDNLPAGLEPVGGHPMCGKELSGLDVAEAGLYRGAPFVLCRLDRTAPPAVALAVALAMAVDASPIELEPGRHDRLVAAISHLPYVLSVALFAAVDTVGQEDDMVWRLAASGFRSTTRLAGSDVTMMADILLTNPDHVLEMLNELHTHLDTIADHIRSGDESRLRLAALKIRALRGEFLDEYGA